MMTTHRNRVRRMGLTLCAALAGGTTLQTCESRLHDAIVTGTRGYISVLLDPTNLIGAILVPDTTTNEP